jgi:hypothetical protein
MSTLRWFVSILICLGAMTDLAKAQPAPQQPVVVIDREYEIKAKYLYYLAAFVKPTNAEADTGDIRIAVIGTPNSTFQQTTERTEFRTLRDNDQVRNVVWQTFPSLGEYEAKFPTGSPPPRIVFLMGSRPGNSLDEDVGKIADSLKGLPVLIVTEDNQRFRQSVAVNFYEDRSANRVKMQVRERSLTERNLQALDAFLKSPAVLRY